MVLALFLHENSLSKNNEEMSIKARLKIHVLVSGIMALAKSY
ncbi:hypothetical protein Bsph_0271 [Lysinibacillus sphaericus C3-41]|uniref:Uncharacterized protein n=1 Tax=Lysinibacillus sphaericus (strain C3-41) TaxID=444177 RepID=B1HU09_LYSSC|nr:hypothetical protein Bsph_0271 [Lysinibacillus sphaericus C3-41]